MTLLCLLLVRFFVVFFFWSKFHVGFKKGVCYERSLKKLVLFCFILLFPCCVPYESPSCFPGFDLFWILMTASFFEGWGGCILANHVLASVMLALLKVA